MPVAPNTTRLQLLINCHVQAYRADASSELQDEAIRAVALYDPADEQEREQKLIYLAASLIATQRPIPSDAYALLLSSANHH